MNDMLPTEELDILITRVVDNEATDADWSRLQELGAKDAAVWRRLAEEQQMHAMLCTAARPLLASSDEVETPLVRTTASRSPWSLRIGAGLGWAAAAALALMWYVAPGSSPTPVNATDSVVDTRQVEQPVGNLTDVALRGDADDLYSRYLDVGLQEGRVVGQLPSRMVEVQRAPDGQGYVVLYVRPILERQRVNDLYKFGVDEQGNPQTLRTLPANFTEKQTY